MLRTLSVVLLAALVACSDAGDTASLDDVGDDTADHPTADPTEALPIADLDADAGPAADAGASRDAGAVSADAGATCSLVVPPHAPHLTYGLHPGASDGLTFLGIKATGISQTIGNAAASAGTHAQDGTAGGYDYSAATDLRVGGMTESQIAKLLDRLASVGIAGWYRKPGYDGWPSSEAPHIHAVYVGAPMKLILRNQVRDWVVQKNGLTSHTTYKFHTWTACQKTLIWDEFVKHNPAKN